jgi:hypothetical protein
MSIQGCYNNTCHKQAVVKFAPHQCVLPPRVGYLYRVIFLVLRVQEHDAHHATKLEAKNSDFRLTWF